MKRYYITIATAVILLFGSTVTANAAGFVPVKDGSTIAYYFLDEANTQYYADGFIEINGMIYGFQPNGLTDTATAISAVSDPELTSVLTTYPPKIVTLGNSDTQNQTELGGQPIVLSNGIVLDANPVTCYNGTFQLTSGKVSYLSGVGFTRVSLKFNYQEGTDGYNNGICYIGLYDADGFEIGISTIKATKNGENSDQIMFNDPEVAYIALIPTNL